MATLGRLPPELIHEILLYNWDLISYPYADKKTLNIVFPEITKTFYFQKELRKTFVLFLKEKIEHLEKNRMKIPHSLGIMWKLQANSVYGNGPKK